MAKEPKHHYIPIFYLQQWAGEDGRLIEFCRRYEGVVARPTHPDGTGYVRGLYKIPDGKPGQEYIIETDLMSAVDTWAARALQHMMIDGVGPGTFDERAAAGWCQFIYSLIVRNPEHLEIIGRKLKTMDQGAILEEIRDRYASMRGPTDPESFDEYKAARARSPLEVAPVRTLVDILQSQRVVSAIASMQWRTTTLNTTKHSLLTSDRPVIMTNGLVVPDAHILLPISPWMNPF
jgi:hypothetical protein